MAFENLEYSEEKEETEPSRCWTVNRWENNH